MSNPLTLDPYAGNILTQGLGPIRSRLETAKALTELPKRLNSMDGIPPHIALHLMMALRDFHLPSVEECRLHQTIDLMVRQNYRYLDPTAAATWTTVSGDRAAAHNRAPAYGAAVVGHSGTGKTEAILRCLRSYRRRRNPISRNSSNPQPNSCINCVVTEIASCTPRSSNCGKAVNNWASPLYAPRDAQPIHRTGGF
jgi:hypothetical protein